ncbi:MAG TPA: putative Ig domain-containing protein [candidate division Zixibacteria bacterium]|nr:putative Ig domain-containing protein [candidate division Zixibacteria bacterium]
MAYPGSGAEIETILELFKAQGRNVGLVSTTYMSHATPAGFGAHDPDRNNLSNIANDYLTQSQPHVLFGGGANGLSSGAAASAGYTVVTDRSSMQSLDTETATMVSGQFGSSHLPYEFDGSYSTLPHLDEMATTALAILDNNSTNGFFLMIEGGRIDHAGHDNELERNIHESLEFSNTVQKVIDWVENTGNDSSWANTLMVITADHETGGLMVTQDNGSGNYPTVTWSTTGHTGVDVPIYAKGTGADQLSGLTVDNTDVYHILLQDFVPGAVDVQISQSSDDVEETALDGSIDLASSDIELGDDPGFNEDQTEGLRFQNVTVPPGATITTAYLEFETDEVDTGATLVSIWAQASDDAPTFTSTVNNVTSRAKTAASISWDIPAWNIVDEHHQSPELKDVVQEVIDRAGWNSGNSMAFVISGTGSRTAESFDGEPAAAAQLHIEFIGGPPNSPPQFNSDPVVENDATKSVPYASTVANDAYDPDGDPLTFSKISGPSWLSVASSGALSGTPLEGDIGLNSWTVEVSDGNGGTEQAELEITVRSDGGSVDVRIAQSDDDVEELVPSGTVDLTSTDVELGDDPGNNEDQTGGLRFQNVYLPQGASITAAYLEFETDEVDTAATVVSIWAQASDDAPAFSSTLYDVTTRATTTASVPWDIPSWNTVNELHQSPDLTTLVQEVVDRPGWSAGSSMVFVISGTGSRTAESFNGEPTAAALLHVEFDLVAANNPPAFDSDPIIEIDGTEDAAYSSTLADDASDPDSDPLTFTKISGPSWLSIATNGALTGLPANADVGLNSWIVEVSDGNGGADQATLEITVVNVNDTPSFSSDPIVESSAAEDSAYSGSIADDASDPDVGDALIFSKESGPAWLVVGSDGALSGTADNDDVGLNGFSVKVADIAGASDTAVLQITVVNTNDPPAFPADPVVESDATEDSPYNGSIAGNATDPDAGDTLTFSKESGPAWLSIASDGTLSGTPLNGDVGTNDFSVKVSDAAAASDTAVLRITVLNTNDPPGFLVDPVVEASAAEGSPYTGTIVDDASDPDIGDTLSFSKESGPSWLTVAADGALSGTPASSDIGQNNFQVTVTDGAGANDTAALQITVLNTNDPPAFTSDPIIEASATEDTPYTSTIADDAADPDAGDTLTFSKQSGPLWLTVTSDGALSGTPLDGDVGLNSFTVDVSDGNGGSDQAELQIFVVDTNDPPMAYAGSDDTISLPAEATLDGTVSDDGLPAPPNLVTTWTVVSGPGLVNFGDDRAVDTTASFTSAGTYVLRLTAGDGEFDVSDEVTITVNMPPSDSPYLEFGKVNGVGDSWTEVTLPRTYNSMVVVASANVNSGDPPAVVRIRIASGNSFEIRVDGAGGGSLSNVTVHYMVVEEGVYNFADHGVIMEAVKYISTVTDEDNSWLGESQSYANSYTNPVVLGQVMSYEDANFSVFWSMGSGVAEPPSSSALTVGKHVAEDPNTTRADETVGYVVIEAGIGSIEGIGYAAGLGADSVQGMTNNPPYSYAISGLPAASTAIVSQAGMDGKDGGWAHLFGANPVSAANLDLVIDEDQLSDSERNHSPEQVAFLVFEDPVVNQPPTADFTYVATDLSVAFTENSTDGDGTVDQWSWDFGDSSNSTQQNPNHTYTTAGTYSVELTVTDDDGATDSTTQSMTVAVTPNEDVIYVSSSTGGSVGGVNFADEDILAYDTVSGVWSMYFDGSDVGLGGSGSLDVDAFHFMDDGSILLSIVGSSMLPDVGSVDDSDVVRFVPTTLGSDTAGTYEWYFDGSDVGLTDSGEDIDAIYFLNGDLIVSTSGGFSVSGASGNDEDLFRFAPTTLGASTSGTWTQYFDGSDVGLGDSSDEDTWGVWLDEANGDVYLTTRGIYSVTGLSGESDDIYVCTPGPLGTTTSCTFNLYLDGAAVGFVGERIDGFTIEH